MKYLRWLARIAWPAPVAVLGTLFVGSSGGCDSGMVLPAANDGAVADGGAPEGGSVEGGSVEGGSGCTPSSCAGLAAPAIAKVCPDGTTLSANVCEDQGEGRCGWGFPPCPTDACAAAGVPPCVPCPYGSVGIGKDANGCDTCPICAPPPDAGGQADACPPGPVCSLPNCMYGVLPQTDSNGCPGCGTCAPAPDAGGGDGGSTSCKSDSDCGKGDVCGFLETGGCGIEGTCVTPDPVACNAIIIGCACDGSGVNTVCTGLPSGYLSKPLRHMGACVDGG